MGESVKNVRKNRKCETGNNPNEDIKDVVYSIFNKYFIPIAEEEGKYFIEKFNTVNTILKNMKS